MVTKTEEGFAIHVKTGSHPANDYVEMTNDIISSLQSQDKDMTPTGNYYLLELLREMLPDFEQAKAMFDEIKDL